MRNLLGFLSGLVFGLGLIVSGMANPAKVLNFLDLAGHWDPSLGFVMGGAVVVTYLGYRLAWRQGAPVLASGFDIPTSSIIGRKVRIPGESRGSAVLAGPGQKPPMPQPRPNSAAPRISGRSIRLLVGMSKPDARTGAPCRQARR